MTTTFKAGDKVRVLSTGYTEKAWIGVEGIVQGTGLYANQYKVKLTDAKGTGREVGYVANLGGKLELVEEATESFKVGDKVTVTAPTMGNYGKTGTITSLESGYKAWPITVEFKAGDDASYAASELELVEPSFTFADIQVGDTIRRTATFNGATEVREGVVGSKGSYYWANEQGNYILAYDTDDKDIVTLELVNRPEPVKADWETAKAGDRLVVEGKETTRILTKQEDGWWDCLMVRTWSDPSRGIRRTDKDVALAFEDPAFSKDGKYKFFPAQ